MNQLKGLLKGQKKKLKKQFKDFDEQTYSFPQHRQILLRAAYKIKKTFDDAEKYLSSYGNEGDSEYAHKLFQKFMNAQDNYNSKNSIKSRKQVQESDEEYLSKNTQNQKQSEEQNDENEGDNSINEQKSSQRENKEVPLQEQRSQEVLQDKNKKEGNISYPQKIGMISSFSRADKKQYFKELNKNYSKSIRAKQTNKEKKRKRAFDRVRFHRFVEIRQFMSDEEAMEVSRTPGTHEVFKKQIWQYEEE